MVSTLFSDDRRASWIAAQRLAERLAQAMTHVALFAIEGTYAVLATTHGFTAAPGRVSIPLSETTPLRWAIEAASPVVGAGRAAEATDFAKRIGLAPSRGYAVVPIADGGTLVALLYLDHGDNPISMQTLATLVPEPSQTSVASPPPRRPPRRLRTPKRQPWAVTAPTHEPTWLQDIDEAVGMSTARRGMGWFAVGLLVPITLATCIVSLLSPPTSAPTAQQVEISEGASFGDIASLLGKRRIVRYPSAFASLAHVTGADRCVHAGTYEFSKGLWAWQVLAVVSPCYQDAR